MNEFSENSTFGRLVALLGLASTKKESVETCPSAQQLALFIDGQLKKKKRQQMLTHLNHCEGCRSIWLETSSYLESMPEQQNETVIGEKIIQGIKNFLNPGSLIISGIAVAILVLVVVMPRSTINQNIDSGFEILSSQHNLEAAKVAKTFTMPWENAVMAFSKAGNQPEKSAFGAGLWQGKNQLISASQSLPDQLMPPGNGHWQDTGWVNYYQFGRWVTLLWVESQLTTNLSDWDKHEKTLMQLRENLAEHPTNQALDQSILLSLEQVAAKIEVLNNQQDIVEKKSLQRLLEIIMQKYSPG